jgi:hypothetical protein
VTSWYRTVSNDEARKRYLAAVRYWTSMVRTWVSGGQNTEVVDRLRKEIADLEAKRDKLVDSNKSKLFQWASHMLKTDSIPDGKLTKEIKEIMAEYESITLELFDKEVLLSERMDEQAKFDSLG